MVLDRLRILGHAAANAEQKKKALKANEHNSLHRLSSGEGLRYRFSVFERAAIRAFPVYNDDRPQCLTGSRMNPMGRYDEKQDR